MKGFFTFVAGVSLGVIIGAAAALLSTPYSGTEVRNRLLDKSRELRKTAEEKIEQGQNVVQERLVTINERIARGLETGSEVLREAANRMRQSSADLPEDVTPA